MGEGSDLPGDLRLMGRAAAPRSRHPGSGHLLGLHEGQPATPELHIEPPFLSLPSVANRLSNPTGRRKDGLKKKKKPTKNRIFI